VSGVYGDEKIRPRNRRRFVIVFEVAQRIYVFFEEGRRAGRFVGYVAARKNKKKKRKGN